jgi:hypothetical protein
MAIVAGFTHWRRTHRGAVTMAGLLSFAVPVTFFTGDLSVMSDPTAAVVMMLASWFVLYAVELWFFLLVIGYAFQRLYPTTKYARTAMMLLGACAAVSCVDISTAARGRILVEQGVVLSSQTMHLYAFISTLIMALLFFAHLQRSRAHEQAAARLASAQAAQRQTQRRLAQARLQAVQARIDPQLLFDMLDAVRRCYDDDAARAEQLLDELIAFLRAALPRLRNPSSSVTREAELARAYVRLHSLASARDFEMALHVSVNLMSARFPPGVLLPLLDDALRARAGPCGLTAEGAAGSCLLALTLPARPTDATVTRVRALLADLYGTSAELAVDESNGAVSATVTVPYEPA